MKSSLRVNLINESSSRAPRALILKLLEAAWRKRGGKTPAEVNLLLVDGEAMRRLNRTHKHRDCDTDVLAFEDGETDPAGKRVRLGDIAVCASLARTEAARRGAPFTHELALYALHGLLHLCGMRDHNEAGRKKMADAQAEEFAALGLRYFSD